MLHLNTFEDENDDFEIPCGLTTFNKSMDGSNDFYISLDGSNISDKTSAAPSASPWCSHSQLLEELSVSEAIKNPSNDSEIPFLHNTSYSTSYFVPPDETRSSTSKVKSPTYSIAQNSAMIDAHAEINASAQQSCYTTIATNSSQTAQLVSDTLEVAPMNEADESGESISITHHKYHSADEFTFSLRFRQLLQQV